MKEEEICNCCGRALRTSRSGKTVTEDALRIRKEWGYFSEKDLQIHHIVLCETCYDAWIKQFKVPVKIEKKQEVLS